MMDGRKLESAALFLTIFGAMLFMPPLVLLFNIHVRVLGIPVEVIYLFVVWFALCAATAWFARRLPHAPASEEKPEADG
jgi:hypothetical protein